MDRLRTASPRYSMTWPTPPPVPIFAITARIRSLAVTPKGRSPVTLTAIWAGGCCGRAWGASTRSTSLVPIDVSAPRAPWAPGCESPQTMVTPGWASPCRGLITCTTPCPARPIGNSRMPNWHSLRSVRPGPGTPGRHRAARATSEPRAGYPQRRNVAVLGGDSQVGPASAAPGEPEPVERLRAEPRGSGGDRYTAGWAHRRRGARRANPRSSARGMFHARTLQRRLVAVRPAGAPCPRRAGAHLDQLSFRGA